MELLLSLLSEKKQTPFSRWVRGRALRVRTIKDGWHSSHAI